VSLAVPQGIVRPPMAFFSLGGLRPDLAQKIAVFSD
jgi:hypothetical protein